jgi:GNAT superfamily N-acetyltransferase
MAHDDITIRRLTPELLDDYLAFFDGPAFTDNPDWAFCYCLFPYYDHAAGDWEERTAEANRAAISEAIGSDRASGFLAYAAGRVVGWCNAAPRERYPQLSRLPGDGASTLATPCFIVDPEWRGRGIGRRLLEAAMDHAQASGMERLEAAPLAEPRTHAERFRGSVAMFEAAGYEKAGELPGGAVLMEKEL